jgi:hypothetical protein
MIDAAPRNRAFIDSLCIGEPATVGYSHSIVPGGLEVTS